MIDTNSGFRLSAYLADISYTLIVPNGRILEFAEVLFTGTLECKYQHNAMVHGFWESGITELKN
jgi:hypothetical protein